MTTEPGGAELQRAIELMRADVREGFAQMHARMDRLVTQDAFNAEQRRVDDRHSDLATDLRDEKLDREKSEAKIVKRIDALGTLLRWVATGILLPLAAIIVDILVKK